MPRALESNRALRITSWSPSILLLQIWSVFPFNLSPTVNCTRAPPLPITLGQTFVGVRPCVANGREQGWLRCECCPRLQRGCRTNVIRKGRIKLGVVAACEWLGNLLAMGNPRRCPSAGSRDVGHKDVRLRARATADRFPRPVDFGARRVEVPAAADIKLASIWLWLRVFEPALGPCPGFGTALRLMLVTPFCGDAV